MSLDITKNKTGYIGYITIHHKNKFLAYFSSQHKFISGPHPLTLPLCKIYENHWHPHSFKYTQILLAGVCL